MNTKLLEWVRRTWKIEPENLSLYKKAVTLPEYETLEFLGDSLLDFIVADYLVQSFPGKPPGWLTKKRMTLVNENALGQLGIKIDLHSVAIFPSTSSKDQITQRVLGDMIEALIAAIYLDKGLEIAKKSLLRVMEMEKITEDLSLDFLDPIGILQEFLAQKNILPPVYKIMKISGTEHEPVFEIEAACVIQSRTFRAIGHGKSKKDASKEAAHKLLETLKKTDQKHTIEESVIKDQESCLQRLHILLAKRGMKLPLYREIMNDNQDSLFIIEASCDGKGIFFKETGKGHSKKMAKQAAAQKILDKLQ